MWAQKDWSRAHDIAQEIQKLKGLGYMLIYTVWKEILIMRLTGIPERVDRLREVKIWQKNGTRS